MMRMWLRVAPLVCLVACTPPHVVVTVEARPTVAPIDTLEVTVRDESGQEGGTTFALTGVALPASFVVATDGRSGALSIGGRGVDDVGALVALGAVEVVASDASSARLVLEPADVPINSTLRGDQLLIDADHAAQAGSGLAVGADGRAIAVFISRGELRGRLVGADGVPAFNATTRTELDFPVDDAPDQVAGAPVIVAGGADIGGAYLAAWERPVSGSAPTRIWWSAIDAAGGARSPQLLVPADQVTRRFPRAAAVPGGWVVVWQEPTDPFDEYAGELRLARVDAAADVAGTPVVVAAGGTGHNAPQVAAGPDGALVVWEDTTTAVPRLLARGFDPALRPRAGATPIVATGTPRAPRVAGGRAGYAVTYWDDSGLADHPWLLQRLDPAGAALGPPIEVARTARSDAFGEVATSAVTIRADGVIGVVWADGDPASDDVDIYLRAFAGDGRPCGAPGRVNTTTAGVQQLPSIAAFGADAFLIAWNDTSASASDPDGGAVRGRFVYLDCP